MMFAMLLLGLGQHQEDPAIFSERETFTLPREIAPAIAPYLMCMLEDREGRLLGLRSGNAVRAGIDRLKTDCRSVRDQAEVRAREMLHASHVAEAERETMIADGLNSIDHSRDRVAERIDSANSPQNDAD